MKTMLEIHAQAIASQVDIYHTFLSKYPKKNNVVFGFVEGQTDPSFYKTYIETLLPDDWILELTFVKGKKNVLKIYNEFDWKRFPRKRIAFFIDRDLSQILGERHPSGENLYITDNYSIENSVVSHATCKRVLEEIYNLHQASEDELETILQKFDNQLECFFKLMIPVMAYISLWRSRGEKVNLNNIKMKKIFTFIDGNINLRAMYTNRAQLVEHFYRMCNVQNKNRSGVRLFENMFRNKDIYRKFVRGKYLIWFFSAFCEHCHDNCLHLCPSLDSVPPKIVSLNDGNALAIIGQRARIPSSLRRFLTRNFLKYVNSNRHTEQ